MKDKIKIILTSLLMILSIGLVIAYNSTDKDLTEEKTDAIKFKEEYEALNNQEIESINKSYTSMTISENNPMYYATYEEVYDVLEGTGVIYLGYPECPWCRNLVPELIASAKKVSVSKIYYINMHDERNSLKLNDEGEIVTEKEGTEGYNKLVEKLNDVLPVYEGLNDDSIKRIYVPLVIFVKDGKVIGTHLSTLDSQEDPFTELTDDQKKELKSILTEKLLEVTNSTCDDAC